MPPYSSKVAPLMKWAPWHDQIVALYVAGYSRQNIAKTLGRCENTVTNIINDPRAQRAMETARKRTYGKMMDAVGDRMVTLGTQAIDNIATTVNEKVLDSEGGPAIGTKAKIHQDNVSFELLSRIGFGKQPQKEDAGTLKLSPETEKKLVDGIERATKAEILYREAEEGEFEEVKEGGNGTGS